MKKVGVGCLFIVLLFCFWLVFDWWNTVSRFTFQIQDQFEVELKADACGTCAMEMPVTMKIELEEIATGEKQRFDFRT